MKKFCFIVVLSFLSFRAYGIHNLQINGSTTPTVTTVDALSITALFDGSGVANATMYYDLNGNGQLDSGDPWIMKSKLIDGGFDDEDEAVNGEYQEIGADPLTFQGKLLFYAEDNGVSDTVLITVVNLASSSHSLSGKVTDPVNKPHILVTTIRIINRDNGQFEYGYGDFTDANGDYLISMPDEYANQYWNVVALDIAEVVPFYSSNDVLNDSIYISGDSTKNLAMCFAPTGTITELTGELRDDLGSLITEPAQIMGIGLIDGVNRARPGKTDGTGKYSISLKKATSGTFYLYLVQASIAGQFYPEFMNPLYQQKVSLPPSPPTITMTNFKAYRTTNIISGHVYLDGAPYDKCHLDCSARDYGGTYAKTFSDGHYIMPVSDSFLPDTAYTITIAKKSIPEDYTVYDKLGSILPNASQSAILPGATGIDFYLKASAVEEPEKKPQTSLAIYPNPFTGKIVFELSSSELTENLLLYDIAGKQVTTLKSKTHNGLHRFVLSGKEKLPSGIYFYSLKVEDRVFKGKVVKLQ